MFWQKSFNSFVTRMRRHQLPVRIRLWDGTEADLADDPKITVTVSSPGSLRYLLTPSLDSLGRGYVEGNLDVDGELNDIIDFATRLAELGPKRGRPRGLRTTFHNRRKDAEAISYHYDVSNEFYQQWLDENMVYSCGYFRNPDDTLEQAQLQKIDHILTKLRLQPGEQLLDIGCGWGSLVIRAAEKFGARATGITLSQNQYDLAQEWIARRGLEDRCEVRMEDYRDTRGSYDKIASVGMFEHVGLRHLREYFSCIRELLTEDGAALNHGITSTDPGSRPTGLGGGDFIGRYVFPHGELPHVSLALRELCEAGLEPLDVENLRRHYTLTLRHWADRFEKAGDTVRQMSDEKRWRIWRIYLAGCAYAFDHHWVALNQILAVRAGNNRWPMTRDYMYQL